MLSINLPSEWKMDFRNKKSGNSSNEITGLGMKSVGEMGVGFHRKFPFSLFGLWIPSFVYGMSSFLLLKNFHCNYLFALVINRQ